MPQLSPGFGLYGFERTVKTSRGGVPSGIFLSHCPELEDAQVSRVYRISTDPANTELEHLTHFQHRIWSDYISIPAYRWRGLVRYLQARWYNHVHGLQWK